MSKPSARNSSLNRSVSAKDLVTAASKFQAPRPRNIFLPVMFPGNGPKSEIPRNGLNGVSLAAGSDRMVYWLGPTFCGVCALKLVIGVDGTRRGIPFPAPALSELVESNTENG